MCLQALWKNGTKENFLYFRTNKFRLISSPFWNVMQRRYVVICRRPWTVWFLKVGRVGTPKRRVTTNIRCVMLPKESWNYMPQTTLNYLKYIFNLL